MKKDKHITINVDEWQYSILKELSEDQCRNITNVVYILLKDAIDKEALSRGYIRL